MVQKPILNVFGKKFGENFFRTPGPNFFRPARPARRPLVGPAGAAKIAKKKRNNWDF